MRFERLFTKNELPPYANIEFRITKSEIRNPDGSLVFQAEDIEVPADWSQVASDVLAQKYFRKAGIPALSRRLAEEDVPEWLWRHAPDEEALEALPEKDRFGGETSAKQVFDQPSMVGNMKFRKDQNEGRNTLEE